ncbi:hypothetical protein LG047_06200 [Methylocystis sp. WRRC1]|uniref:hypothetical protein n=1 Tax=Methylocystis sp. WRRC1 TaxID=1732014 RepID=UPI001D15A2D1|nr:hypothetical protein [Methylocystis sp. WRRC1]MCC3244914.1 hypothetical protein [Methylocystis sp. WRRC1]
MPKFASYIFCFRRSRRPVLITALFLLACDMLTPVKSAVVSPRDSGSASAQEQPVPVKTKYCSDRGKGLVQVDFTESYGEVCEAPGETMLARVAVCMARGMEAVLVPDLNGVVCAAASRGGFFLESTVAGKPRYEAPKYVKAAQICADAQTSDRRVLPRGFVKDLVRETKDKVDPKGIRLIGAIFCEGLDLSGLDIPYTLALDRSTFRCGKSTECRRSPVEVRNFRTKGDFSLDTVLSYERILITRAEISGSLWMEFAYAQKLVISDTTVKGSLRLKGSLYREELNIENVAISGDVDLSASFFSNVSLLKNQIDGALDLTQSQARCSFDIRKNEIADIVGVEFGFGSVKSPSSFQKKDDAVYGFKDHETESIGAAGDENAFERYANSGEVISKNEMRHTPCKAYRAIVPGVLVFINNHVKYSMCLRDFRWLSDYAGRPRDSIIYLNEDVVDGAAWLDLDKTLEASTGAGVADEGKPILSIFNFRTGTLVLDFGVATRNVVVKVNGLHFQRVYSAKDRCETALSPRSSARQSLTTPTAGGKPLFPPDLHLPDAEDVTAWVTKNEFIGTQPFQEFVAVFEKAGDLNGARDLKIKGETAAVKANLCMSWGVHCDGVGRQVGDATRNAETNILRRIEGRFVSIVQYALWWLADHGYRPERVIWFVALALLLFWLFIQTVLGIVGYSVDGETDPAAPRRIKPISFIFLFDKLVPAYRIREEHSKPLIFYVLPTSEYEKTYPFRRFLREWSVTEASEKQRRQIELSFDWLRFLGLIFAIFLVAAISRLVR